MNFKPRYSPGKLKLPFQNAQKLFPAGPPSVIHGSKHAAAIPACTASNLRAQPVRLHRLTNQQVFFRLGRTSQRSPVRSEPK